jgi:hypothetical protein
MTESVFSIDGQINTNYPFVLVEYILNNSSDIKFKIRQY